MKRLVERRKICNRLGERYYPLDSRRDLLLQAEIETHLPRGGVFLDAGAGPGMRLARFFSNQAGLSVGIDLEAPASAACGAVGVVGDLEQAPFVDASVDLIAMRSVVEHLADPSRVLAGFARILKPGGWLIALAPSRWYYASIIGRLMPGRLARGTLEFIYGPTAYSNYPTWYRANTPRTMARAARDAGLVIVETRVCPHPPDYLKFSPVLFRLGVLFDRLTSLSPVTRLLQPSFLFVLRRP